MEKEAKFVTDEELVDYMDDVIKVIWKAKQELRSEFTEAMSTLQVTMLRRFDTFMERVNEKIERRLKPIENDVGVLKGDVGVLKQDVRALKKDVIFLKKNVGLILKIVSNGKKKH